VPVEAGDSTNWNDRRVHFSHRRANVSTYGQPALIDPRSGRRFEVTEGRGLAALFALHRALTGATVICIDISAYPLLSYQRVVSRTVLQTLAAQVTTSDQVTSYRGRTVKTRVEKQTRKRVIVRAQRGTFEETGLMLITNRQHPGIGADAYLVTHPDWWASDDEFSSRQANAAIASSIHRDWHDENNPDDSDDAESQVLDEVDTLTTNRVKLTAALLQTSGEVAMRRFADLLVPYMAIGRDDATV